MRKKIVEKNATLRNSARLWQAFCHRLAAPDMAGLLAKEKCLLVALSGGGDSLALTFLLKKWCDQQGKELIALHVNHGLRRTADAEAARLQKMMARYNIPLRLKKLPSFGDKKNLHHRARRARYDALMTMARAIGGAVILLGHQENDVAENLLMRLSRRAGIHGLAAMAAIVGGHNDFLHANQESRKIYFMRPLLGTPRAALQEYLKEEKIKFFDDPSNHDDKFLRARTRKILTRLSSDHIATPADIAATARYLRIASDFIMAMAEEKKSTVLRQGSGMVVIHRFYPHAIGKVVQQPGGQAVEVFLLHHWLRLVMQQWQDDKMMREENSLLDFPPPQDQIEKIIAAHQPHQMIFDYPAYWVISDDKKILVIKKSPNQLSLMGDAVCHIKRGENIIWNKIYKIENHGDDDCHVVGLGRGKNFLRQAWGKNFVGCDADEWLSETTSRYFYAQQPKFFWQDETDYCLPSLRLYRSPRQAAAVTLSPLFI